MLETIVARRREDVREARRAVPFPTLRDRVHHAPTPIDFAARLEAAGPMAIMAEIKRASPSKGDIAPSVDAAHYARRFAQAGAAAISVLTEPTWFKGSLEDLAGARAAIESLPHRPAILRKDFIVDEYQLVEARAAGADSVLLIVASLTDAELGGLLDCSRSMEMEPLVEAATAAEVERALKAGARVVGINNRDLRDFSVDLETTGRLAGMIPPAVILAALSGISTRADVERFAAAGARAVLVGEALMRARDPAQAIRELAGR